LVIDGKGGEIQVTRSFTLAAVNDAPTGSVTITGTPTQGQTLTASNNLADVDGLGAITYQWQKSSNGINWNNISLTTNLQSLPLTSAEAGNYIRVVASYTDLGGVTEIIPKFSNQYNRYIFNNLSKHNYYRHRRQRNIKRFSSIRFNFRLGRR
jgi:hypothetical protein